VEQAQLRQFYLINRTGADHQGIIEIQK
jgi:hypothetical protein